MPHKSKGNAFVTSTIREYQKIETTVLQRVNFNGLQLIKLLLKIVPVSVQYTFILNTFTFN